MTAWWVTGDVSEVLGTLPDDSVDLVLTSPPFLALRSYLPADHPDKKLEGGSQATPAAFVDWLLSVCDELGRVLAPHGTLCIELGDTYAGSGGAGGDYAEGGMRDGAPAFDGSASRQRSKPRSMSAVATADAAPPARLRTRRHLPGWPLDKSLSLVPEAFRLSLAYGRNVLGGEWEGEPWRIRNVVRWCRPNPPVGALGDKFRPATTDVVVACRARDRWFDLDAVRAPAQDYSHRNGAHVRDGIPGRAPQVSNAADENGHRIMSNPSGAPPHDWWEVSTQPYKGAHHATWPTALCERPVKAMCPERVCRTCGGPSRRVVDAQRIGEADDRQRKVKAEKYRLNAHDHPPELGWEFSRTTTGWTDCGHDDWRPGVVLDPFAGSGTTLAVATGHGRDAIGVDLDERNADLARARVGMWLEETTAEALAETLNIDHEEDPAA